MSTKRKLAIGCSFAAALAATLLYGAMAKLELYSDWHVQTGAINSDLRFAFDHISAYREKNGRWPRNPDDAVGRDWTTFRDPLKRVSDRPDLYNPDAKPGTKEILIAQPVPVSAGLWPFKETWQIGITADGDFVNLAADGRGVDHLK